MSELQETLSMLTNEMQSARSRVIELERENGHLRNDLMIADVKRTMLVNENERLSKHPDVWISASAEAFWRVYENASLHHGHSESTWAGINAALKAQGMWK